MQSVVIDIVYGILMAAAGAICAWYVLSRWTVWAGASQPDEVRRAAEVLARLHDLTTQVAIDLDEHNGHVEEIAGDLSMANVDKPAMIVDVVAKLIQANHDMQEKLSATEEKLRDQAEEIQLYATEARTDPLTLLANRRVFDDELERRLSEFSRHGRVFSIIMADVDRFKGFNDGHGHPAGDRVLQTVARLLRRKVRDMDLVSRYGGEEFAVILPGTGLEEASRAALRAREAIESFQFAIGSERFDLTASFGVAEVSEGEDAATLVTRVDKALYAAKEGGRNCVYKHDGRLAVRITAEPAGPAAHELPAAPAAPPVEKTNNRTCVSGTAAGGDPGTSVPGVEGSASTPELVSRTNFCHQVRNRSAEWKRGGAGFSIVLVEVDHFDRGAGRRSQQARELVMSSVARFLTATVREMDTVGNYAPGCFAMLLPTAELADAVHVGARLCDGFLQYAHATQAGPAGLTLSVGVVQIMEQDESTSLLRRAETALHAAKSRGGNQVYYHDGDQCVPMTRILENTGFLATSDSAEEIVGGSR